MQVVHLLQSLGHGDPLLARSDTAHDQSRCILE